MTHASLPAPARGVVIALPIARDPAAEARLVAVAPHVSALVFEADDASGPLMAFVDGTRAGGALVGTRLALRSGGFRHVVLVGLGADELRGRPVALARGRRVIAAIDPDWLQPPDAEPGALIEDLTDAGALRLLRLLLTTGASLFRAAGPEFASLARRLLDGLGLRAAAPVAVAATGRDSRLVTWRVARDLDLARIGDLVALAPARPRRLARPALHLERRGGATLLHVELPGRLPQASVLVATGGTPLALAVPAAAARGDLAAFLRARDPATVRFAHRLVEARMERDPIAAALAAELRHAAAPAPALGLRHLSATPRGIVFALAVTDPHRLVAAVRLLRGDRSLDIAATERLEGYAPLPRQSRIDDRCRLALVLRSGRVIPAEALRLPRFDGAAPPGLTDATALAAARLDREPPEGPVRIESFGAPAAPRLTIATPLAADLDLVRARAALIFAEPRGRAVEVVCWTADPALVAPARGALAQAAAAWGVAHRLVVLPDGATEADGLPEALRAAAGARVLVLAPSVLPAAPGWLARCLRRRVPVARVRDHDGAPLADAGDAAVTLPAGVLPTPSAILAGPLARSAPSRPAPADFVAFAPLARPAIEAAADAATLALALARAEELDA